MDMNQLMRQAQKMQKDLEKKQKDLKNLSFEGSAGGSCVTVVLKGDYTVEKISIEKDFPQNDIEILEDMIQAAFNNATEKVRKESEKILEIMPKGLSGMPPFF